MKLSIESFIRRPIKFETRQVDYNETVCNYGTSDTSLDTSRHTLYGLDVSEKSFGTCYICFHDIYKNNYVECHQCSQRIHRKCYLKMHCHGHSLCGYCRKPFKKYANIDYRLKIQLYFMSKNKYVLINT